MQVTINRPDMAGLNNSVCSLKSDRRSGLYGGHGVFLMPDIILTAWHVVSQSRNLTVMGPDGRTAEIVRGSEYAKKSEKYDLATLELSRPLTSSVAIHTDTDIYARNMRGHLVSAFGGAVQSHRAGINHERREPGFFRDAKYMQDFLCDEKIVKGYSGSPVFDARGRLVSVACEVNMDVLSGNTREKPPSEQFPDGLYRFRGPRAEYTASFVRRALDI